MKGRAPNTVYRVRRKAYKYRGKSYVGYDLTLPPALAAQIPDDATFTVELTEEGILYRINRPTPRPTWVKKEGGGGDEPEAMA